MFAKRVSSSAQFAPDRMGKCTLMRGDLLFVGLNAFEPGQGHAPYVHEGQDKLYFILKGIGVVHIGEQAEMLFAGDAAFAPSSVAHSIRNPARGTRGRTGYGDGTDTCRSVVCRLFGHTRSRMCHKLGGPLQARANRSHS